MHVQVGRQRDASAGKHEELGRTRTDENHCQQTAGHFS